MPFGGDQRRGSRPRSRRPARRPAGTPGSRAARRARPAIPGEPPSAGVCRLVGHDGPAAATARGAHHAGAAQAGDGLAQRRRGTHPALGELPLRRQRRPEREDAEPDRRGQLLHAALEGVVAAHRPGGRASPSRSADRWLGPSSGKDSCISQRRSQAESSAESIVRIGPLNQFLAESCHQIVIASNAPRVTIGE